MKNRPLFSRRLLKGAFKKYIRPTIEAMSNFIVDGHFSISLVYLHTETRQNTSYEAEIILTPRENKKGIGFEIKINDQIKNGGVNFVNSYGLTSGLNIYGRGTSYHSNAGSIRNFECNFPALPRKLTGYLTNLRTNNKPYDNSYFRLCVPVEDADIIYPTEIIDRELHLVFDVSHWDMQPSVIGIVFPSIKGMTVELTVKGFKFHFYAIENIKCVFIDSLEKLAYYDFQEIARDIRGAFAFLTARQYSGDTFIVISKDKNFKTISDVSYILEDEPVYGKQRLINPIEWHTYFHNFGSMSFIEKFKNSSSLFSAELFSQFCDLLSQNKVLKRAVDILVSSCSNKNVLHQGILCSVALETITELVADENVVKPIAEKRTAKKLISRLKDVVTIEFSDISEEALRVINAKLSELNKPTNKSKLLFPFHFYKLFLSEIDERMLNHRNDFLHGRSPVDEDEAWALEQIAMKLHYLASTVILKYVGYSGPVMNLPLWNLFYDQERMAETFPVDNDRLKEIVEKLKKNIDPDDSDFEALKISGYLSQFIEDMVRII